MAGNTAEGTVRPDRSVWQDPRFWLSIGLSIFAIAPFAAPGYFWGANDARHHVYFLHQFARVFADGVWWPRWSPDFAFGYGYPFFNIYGPLSHWIALFNLEVLQLSYTAAIEVVFALGIVGSAAATYLYVRSLAGARAGLVSAMLYTYAPYHLLVLYVRGNLAESSAYLWLPFCLWTFHGAIERASLRWIGAAAVCYAGLLVTSNLLFVLFSPLLILYAMVVVTARRRGRHRSLLQAWTPGALGGAAAGLLGLGLSAIFWIPMVWERNYVRLDQWFDGRYAFQDNFLYLYQLLSPRWGFGVSRAGPDDSMGFQIGLALTILGAIGAWMGWRYRRLRSLIVLFSLSGLAAAYVTTSGAAWMWELPLLGGVLQFAQFPWRWLPITALAFSILGGFVLARPGEAGPVSLVEIALATTILLASYPLLQVEIRDPAEGPVSLAGLMRFQRDADELTGSTAWVREIPTWSPMAEYYVDLDRAGQEVTPVTSKVDYEEVDYQRVALGSVAHSTVMEEIYFCTDPGQRPGECSPRDDTRIVFNHFYYPGWRAYLLDGMHGKPVQELPVVPEGCILADQIDNAEQASAACPPFPSMTVRARALAIETAGNPLGRMVVPIPPLGEGYIQLVYGTTAARRWGTRVTVLTLFVFLTVWMVRHLIPTFLSARRSMLSSRR